MTIDYCIATPRELAQVADPVARDFGIGVSRITDICNRQMRREDQTVARTA